MSSRQVLFIGDCQAEMLARTYQEFVASLNDERVRFIPNRQEAVTAVQNLLDTDTVVLQVFDTLQLVSAGELRPEIKTVEFPSVFLGCLWPYCQGGQQLGDTFLDRLILEGTTADDALKRYLDLDIARAAHLDQRLALHIENQEIRDEKTGFAFAAGMEAKFRDEALFLTPAHPTMPLWLLLLRGVLERLQVPGQVTEHALQSQRVHPFPQEALPIHPSVIRHFGLKFVTESSRYPSLHGESLSFSEFVVRYMTFVPTLEPDRGWGWSARKPEKSREHVAVDIPQSPEPFVQSLYRLLLDREPDAEGFAANVSGLRAGLTFQALLKIFLESDEFKGRHPGFHSWSESEKVRRTALLHPDI